MAGKHKVSIITYDTSKDESSEILEKTLSEIHTNPDRYEIISFDKSITPIGSFVCVLIYKELPDEDDVLESDDLDIVVDENGEILIDELKDESEFITAPGTEDA